MQQKCLKSDIYINENYFCDSLEQAIDVDFTLPDFCPDISKIFKCHAVPRITSKSLSGNNITVDGNVIITFYIVTRIIIFALMNTYINFQKMQSFH